MNLLQTCSFSLHMTLFDGLEWCGLLVDYCDVFISCLDSHSDGTHSLQRIHLSHSLGWNQLKKKQQQHDATIIVVSVCFSWAL